MQRSAIVFGAVAAAGLATAVFFGRGSVQPDPSNTSGSTATDADTASNAATTPVPSAAPCAFPLGQVHTYAVTSSATYHIDPSALLGEQGAPAAAQQTYESNTTWTISLRPVARSEGEPTIVAFHIEDWVATVADHDATEGVEGVDRPFLAEIDDRCRVRNVARETDNTAEALHFAQAALDAITVVGPEDPTAQSNYTAIHVDAIGQFVARYVWVPASDDGPRRAVRERDHYIHTPADQGLRLERQIVRSRRDVEWGPGAFYQQFDGLEQTRESSGGNVSFADVTERTSVRTVPARQDAFDGFDLHPRHFVWGRVDLIERLERGDGSWAGRPIDDVLTEFERLQALGTRDGMRLAREALVDYLRDNPEAAELLVARIQNGEFTPIERALIMHALSEAGTPEARQALIDMAYDVELDENTRTQAAAALGDLVNPTVETVEQLAELGRNTEEYGDDLGLPNSAARMSIGALMGRHEGRDDIVEAGRVAIDEVLRTDDPMVRRQGLIAAGNSGDEYFIEAIERAVRDTDSDTRRVAARAARRMEIEATDPIFRDQLRNERQSTVIAEMANTQRVQVGSQDGEPSGETIDHFIAALRGGASVDARARIIELLGSIADTNAIARQALIDHFPHEPEARLREMIGRYVTAAELAGR